MQVLRDIISDLFSHSPLKRSPRFYALTYIMISAILLLTALVMEYVFDVYPCIFCIYERWFYVGIITVSLLPFLLMGHHNTSYFLWLLAFVCLGAVGTTAYHVAIEHHWIAVPKACGGNLFQSQDIAALKSHIMNRKIVSCDQVPMRIFGLSLAEYNLLINVVLMAVAVRLSLKVRK